MNFIQTTSTNFHSKNSKLNLKSLNNSDIAPYHLQHEKMGPRIIQAYRRVRSEKTSPDGYNILLLGYTRSPFRVFESYLRTVVDIDEDNIQLISRQNNSNFVTH